MSAFTVNFIFEISVIFETAPFLCEWHLGVGKGIYFFFRVYFLQ